MFSVCLMQPWIYNLVLTSAESALRIALRLIICWQSRGAGGHILCHLSPSRAAANKIWFVSSASLLSIDRVPPPPLKISNMIFCRANGGRFKIRRDRLLIVAGRCATCVLLSRIQTSAVLGCSTLDSPFKGKRQRWVEGNDQSCWIVSKEALSESI